MRVVGATFLTVIQRGTFDLRRSHGSSCIRATTLRPPTTLERLIQMPKNDGKQWTTQDKRELKTLARDTNVSTDKIATKLGRTVPAVRAQAQRQNTSLKPKSK